MSLTLSCPHCRRSLLIKKPKPGSTIPCPVCAGLFQVPGAEEKTSPTWWVEKPAEEKNAPAAAPPEPPSDTSRPERMAFNFKALGAVAAGGLLLTGVVLTAAGAFRAAPAPAPVVVAAAVVTPPLTKVAERAVELPAPVDDVPQVALAPAIDKVADGDPLLDNPTRKGNLEVEGLKEAKPEPKPERLAIRRINSASDEDLRKQLLKTPEVTLDHPNTARRSMNVQQVALQNPTLHLAPKLMQQWPDLSGMPYRMGADCQLGKEHAENMQAMSRKLRSIMAESMNKNGRDGRIDADFMKSKMEPSEFQKTAAVACMMQMLSPENTDVRKLMVNQLKSIPHRTASEALAKVAMFDLADEVRDEALNALNERPRGEYRQVLLNGLRHVFPAGADHAAEALVSLQDRGAIPALRGMAHEPDPASPYYDNSTKSWVAPELARVNHLSNCLMCHAPSRNTSDMVRGRMPVSGQPLPPLSQYYEDNTGIFVRADVTYLKQDFSVYQPVDNQGKWPLMQRYDYVVRNRKIETQADLATRMKAAESNSFPQRQSVMFALGELSR